LKQAQNPAGAARKQRYPAALNRRLSSGQGGHSNLTCGDTDGASRRGYGFRWREDVGSWSGKPNIVAARRDWMTKSIVL
jgi:hypothetical protein